MGRFEEVINLYKEASQLFVQTHEQMLISDLEEFYKLQDDAFLEAKAGLTKKALNDFGLEGLIQCRKHAPIAEFYCGFAEELYRQLFENDGAKNRFANALLSTTCGFRMDIEYFELEHEFSMNDDLNNEDMVNHLLKLKGPFGTRAYTACKGGIQINAFGPKIVQYSILMQILEGRTADILRYAAAENEKQKKEMLNNQPKDSEGSTDIELHGDC